MIPNTIHCCWLGSGPKTALAEKCRGSWRRFAPGWEIREWTAADLAALDPPPFVDEAMRRGKWAFAADWLRFAALAAEGGVYLDYDVELVRPLVVEGEFVAGQWLPGGKVGMEPAVLALEKGSAVAAAMLEAYRGASFDAVRTVGERLGEALNANGLSVKVLPPEVFSSPRCTGSSARDSRIDSARLFFDAFRDTLYFFPSRKKNPFRNDPEGILFRLSGFRIPFDPGSALDDRLRNPFSFSSPSAGRSSRRRPRPCLPRCRSRSN